MVTNNSTFVLPSRFPTFPLSHHESLCFRPTPFVDFRLRRFGAFKCLEISSGLYETWPRRCLRRPRPRCHPPQHPPRQYVFLSTDSMHLLTLHQKNLWLRDTSISAFACPFFLNSACPTLLARTLPTCSVVQTTLTTSSPTWLVN
jgi:hypothetical protein